MRGFEHAVDAGSRKKTCHVWRDPDTFDGRAFTPDEWYAFVQPSFAEPSAFFKDFAPGGLQLRATPDGSASHERYEFDTPIPSREPENNTVPLWWFKGARPARTIALVVPGWGRSDRRVEDRFCGWLVSGGIDVALLTPPYHLERTPTECYSGELFISANLLWTVENFRQLTAEIRLLVQQMRRHYDYVALIGISSGGFQAGLASLGEPVDALIPIMTGCRLGSITFHGISARYVRRDCEQRGVDEAALNRAWSICDLDVVGHATRARHIKQYIMRYDSLVPTQYQEALWEVYKRPDRCDVPSSHYGVYFYLRSICEDIARWLTLKLDV